MVIYIHGFGGSGEGSKAKVFREYFKSIGEDFIAPSLSYVPELAIKTLEELIESYKGDVYLIGSSLGGYYTTYLSKMPQVKKVVLINPSVNPIDTLQRAIGNAPNFFDESYYNWNEKHLKMLEEYKVENWYMYHTHKNSYMLLVQKGDKLLDYKEAVEKYDGAKQIIEDGGNHSFENIENHFETIEKFFAIGNHFRHTTKVKGVGLELDELANRVGDLYYDDLAVFLESLSKKLLVDSNADRDRGRDKLSNSLLESVASLNQTAYNINNTWKLCKIPTIRWMIENGFNKNIDIPKMDNLPPDIMEWYYGKK